ncbi:uncharacterized protein [Rutidosis leptorrhynchoides]|uniref:uncharacterized protein n=1 Tax=Rutidosis leptorrhynchoides TaxID=125765 RepID=UPI003A99CF68
MSKQQELQTLNNTTSYTTPIIMENDNEATYDDETTSSNGCFRLFCCFDTSRDGETAGFLYHQPNGGGDLINQDTWIMKRAKSLKQYSEIVAGPKWKNFIRKFSKKPKNRSNANTQFQYDPQSYALNFNDGDVHEDDDLLPRSFSTRYAPPSRSTQL